MNSVPVKKCDETIGEYIDNLNDTTTLDLVDAINPSSGIGWGSVLFSPLKTFFKVYIAQRKILDGVEGFTTARLAAIYSLASNVKLWEFRMREKKGLLPPTTKLEIEALKKSITPEVDTINLSVIVITRNEEDNIVECLQSVSWAKEIILVDSQSTDRTVELAKQFTEIIFVREWSGYASAKNFALENAASEWVLWLDADERVTAELALEIQEIINLGSTSYAGYEVGRRAYFLGKWIKHSGWYPGYVVRLFKRAKGQFDDLRVHEKMNVDGTIGKLNHDLIHYTDNTLYHYLEKFNRYTTLAAEDMKDAGKTISLYDLIIRPSFLFFKMYFLRCGFLDGMHGFVLARLSASYVFVKYAKVNDLSSKLKEK